MHLCFDGDLSRAMAQHFLQPAGRAWSRGSLLAARNLLRTWQETAKFASSSPTQERQGVSIALVPICPDLTRIDIMPGQFDKLMSFRFYSEDLVNASSCPASNKYL